MKKIILLSCSLTLMTLFTAAQRSKLNSKTFIFSAIKGSVSKPDSVQLSGRAVTAVLASGDIASFKTVLNKQGKLIVTFTPGAEFIGISTATLQVSNAAGKPIYTFALTGLSTKGLEGENEPTLGTVAKALGYTVNIGWTTLANHSRPELQGDEIPYQLFHKAGKGEVEIIPVARYSPDFLLPFGYYTDSAAMPVKHEVGVLAKRGIYPEHQCLFPALSSGNISFDPGKADFGFYATGPTHTAYSEDVWNMLFFPGNAVRATRIYPLKDASGTLISHTYLLCYEEAKNGDYNDYVFLVKNIAPTTTDLFTSLFNGKNLNGWHTFLKGIGKNSDPDSNFIVEDGALHVKGKDLGYAITDKGYRDFHFSIEFKWGQKKWPPRENAKRDGGVCYNIGMNEPDSIWPRSIECQIQEGDVGDFWLLGFSTITVNGVQNQAANHTRMIKQKDGEKPNGEWNRVEIISYHGRCIQVVNGIVVNVGDNASIPEGRLLMQSEYSEIYYRNVRIRKL